MQGPSAQGPSALVRHEAVGVVEPTRLAIRFSNDPHPEPSDDGRYPSELASVPLESGVHLVGPFEVAVGIDSTGPEAEVAVTVRSAADRTLRLESVILGSRLTGPSTADLRFLRHGWQSWSFTGSRPLTDAGETPFPSGPWVRSFHHGMGAPAADRAGWHESDLVSVVGTPGGACLLGVLERGVGTGLVYLRKGADDVALEAEIQLEVPISPLETVAPEPIRLALGPDENALLESYADALGRRSEARTHAPFQTGWCSWYQFFNGITEEKLLRNLEVLAKRRGEIPIDVVQLDDGYQRAIGDWLVTGDGFPRGIAPIAEAIRDAGFRPGIWTAPFSVVPESRVYQAHPEWLLRYGDGLHRGFLHPTWTKPGHVFVLDTSRDDVCEHLMRVFAGLTGMGFTYHKIDFLFMVAMRCQSHDPRVTRAGRLRRGLEAIRRGAGEDAFVLGCGSPLGAAVGHVDGMRIGPDVAPFWEPRPLIPAPGIEPVEPSTKNAIRNVLARAWMHRRLWLNDPDCLMVREQGTELSVDQVRSLAGAIAATGGMLIFSDDVPRLGEAELERVREVAALGREVDAGAQRGTARAVGLLESEIPAGVVGSGPEGDVVALLQGDDAGERTIDLDALAPGARDDTAPLLGTKAPTLDEGRGRIALSPHETTAFGLTRDLPMAVFCDFDGTFAVQDVGSTLAKRHAGERRAGLWERLRKGELGAWEYYMELLDGLELPEEKLDAFLRTVELDPGARSLMAFCESNGLPFRILSDGFGRNLDRLMELNDLRFAYEANHLWYEDGRWRLAAGSPDPSCTCGTGVCKRATLRAYRAAHPESLIVHVGNGRVSDLCASEEADLVYAKDTLAEELTTRGIPFEPFETLAEVEAGLAKRLAERTDTPLDAG